jgi:uncharacterized protein YraI
MFKALVASATGMACFISAAAEAQNGCGHPHGDHVVIEVKSDDPIGGLAVRSGPNAKAERRGIIPAVGTGIGVGRCEDSGWCEVKYQCLTGWSLSARYLAPRARRVSQVTGVSPADPDGLNVRTGPSPSTPVSHHIPYNSAGIVRHTCEAANDSTQWCLVTFNGRSGWTAGRYLQEMTVATSPSTVPPPVVQPVPTSVVSQPAPASLPAPPSTSPLDPTSRACRLFPNLC